MNRITDYSKLKTRIVSWIKNYATSNNIKSLVVGISGGIDSSVVSTLCAETGLPTYVVSMPLNQIYSQSELSDVQRKFLFENYSNVIPLKIDLSSVYDQFVKSTKLWLGKEFSNNKHSLANTKSRIRMVTLYQIAGDVGGIVVGTGNKVEDYGVGFYTKYGDGGVDIAPIADLYKTEVWELGKHLGVDPRIVSATPTDGLWDDGRTDEDQIGASYVELEEAMETGSGPGLEALLKFSQMNQHKMNTIPTFKL